MRLSLRNSALLLAAVLGLFASCKKDEDSKPVSGFTYEIDATDYKTVHFTSTATNSKSLSWNFGDGSALSTETNPSHTFAGVGEYTVSLTATNGSKQNVVTQKINIVDPEAQLTAIAGDNTKTWKLLRVVTGDKYPLEVGPYPKDGTIWWAPGLNNDEIANRYCLMNDEWTFSRDGKMTYNSNGDFWAEGGVFADAVANSCQATTAANLINNAGDDLSAFGDGQHTYAINGTKLELSGLGAWIGLTKIATSQEVTQPQQNVTLDILELSDAAVDYLVLESKFNNADPSGTPTAYWKIVLVHYDDPSQEPPIPGPKPVGGFTFTSDVFTFTFTNTSTGADSYSWDFGDGGTSTQASPVHTYASAGVYTVKMTATNVNGSVTVQQDVIAAAPMSIDDLVGGAWRVRGTDNSVFVGPGLGNGDWYKVPGNFLDGSSTGADDWSCMTDDEFIFTLPGTMQYKTNGTARNDSYMGTPNGCWTDAEIAASGNGAAFGSGTHSFEFIPAAASPSGRPIIKLTNGATGAAFIGFYKGYYGGENANSADLPNGGNSTTQYEVMGYLNDGTTETLTVSVDISTAHDASRAWTMVLVR